MLCGLHQRSASFLLPTRREGPGSSKATVVEVKASISSLESVVKFVTMESVVIVFVLETCARLCIQCDGHHSCCQPSLYKRPLGYSR